MTGNDANFISEKFPGLEFWENNLKGGDIMVAIIIAIIVCSICGYILGYVFGNDRRKPIGTLRIDSSDPDGPYLFLELETDPSIITKEKSVLLKVDTRSYISQK